MGQERQDGQRIRQIHFSRRLATFLSIGVIGISGSPLPAQAQGQAAPNLVCSSSNYSYSHCNMNTGKGVRLAEQFSHAACIQDRTWGADRNGVWVDQGCSALFQVSTQPGAVAHVATRPGAGAYVSRPRSEDVVGAVIIGGLIGAALGASGSSGNRYPTSMPPYRGPYYNNASRHYDRNGYPNYDRWGRSPSAPPEPGQSQFRGGAGYGGPPEPGQSQFRGGGQYSGAPPEPGQSEFRGGAGNEGPPEPGQSEFRGGGNDDE